jgi:SAM-dependent methyltransferase
MPEEPGRFHSAARHYLQGRPPYAAALIRRVVRLCGLGTSDRLLDLGCGPGQLALAFAPYAGHVIAMDPEPEMLRVARQEVARAGLAVEIREASSRDLSPDPGTFRLVVIGRAFHWMDRPQTLARLDRIIEREGAVVLFHDEHPRVPDNRWCESFQQIIDRYSEADPVRATWRAPDWVIHEAVLLNSAFCRLERVSVIERRATPVESFVDRALSFSSVSPDRLGARADDLAREIRDAMIGSAKNGLVTEVVESEALIARRSAPPSPGRNRSGV